MTPEFFDFFINNPGQPYLWEGKEVWPDLTLSVSEALILNVDVISYVWRPKQLITYFAMDCKMQFADGEYDYVHIHAASKPRNYRIDFVDIRPGAKIVIHNSWRLRDSVEFGIGNAGMIIEDVDIDGKPGYLCSCSDHWRKTDFKSLRFQVQIARGSAERLVD